MDVILLERLERLGQMGDVVQVRPGFARNFLFPQKKAVRANKDNKAFFESKRAELEALNASLVTQYAVSHTQPSHVTFAGTRQDTPRLLGAMDRGHPALAQALVDEVRPEALRGVVAPGFAHRARIVTRFPSGTRLSPLVGP